MPAAEVPTTLILSFSGARAGTATDALKLPSDFVTTEPTTWGSLVSSTISTLEAALNPEPESLRGLPATALSGASTIGAVSAGGGAATMAAGGRRLILGLGLLAVASEPPAALCPPGWVPPEVVVVRRVPELPLAPGTLAPPELVGEPPPVRAGVA